MTVSLELNRLEISRPKKSWQIYFLVLADHPTQKDKMVMATLPDPYLSVVPAQDNQVHFDGGDARNEGLLLLHRNIKPTPGDVPQLNVHCFIRHSREGRRKSGSVLQDLSVSLGSQAQGLLPQLLGTTHPWLVIARKAFPLVGQLLAKTPDRDLGFVSMFERFGPEFSRGEEKNYVKIGGDCTLHYSWITT